MSVFSDLKSEGLEESQDRLGGYSTKETDAYEATIKVAYTGKSSGGARFVTLVVDINGSDYTETVYVTNKNGENFFLNAQDKTKKLPLPGFTIIDDLCVMATDKPLFEQDTEEKVVKIYDYDQRKEVPTTVPVLTELTGKQAVFGIVKQVVDKNKKNDSTGEYEPTGETREENVIEKVFHYPSLVTVPEARQGISTPEFHGAWTTKNKGKTRNRSKADKGGAAGGVQTGRPGATGNAGAGTKPTSSLFKK